MKAKDTVMGWRQLNEVYKESAENVCSQRPFNESAYRRNVMRGIAEAQAEISFKAGMNEVMEWGDETCYEHQPSAIVVIDGVRRILKSATFKRRDCAKCLQAKLKEWGIKEGK